MIRRILTWEPPLAVSVALLFAVTCGVSLALSGRIEPDALVLGAVCTGGYLVGHRRRSRLRR